MKTAKQIKQTEKFYAQYSTSQLLIEIEKRKKEIENEKSEVIRKVYAAVLNDMMVALNSRSDSDIKRSNTVILLEQVSNSTSADELTTLKAKLLNKTSLYVDNMQRFYIIFEIEKKIKDLSTYLYHK